jgi:hypothetical protein
MSAPIHIPYSAGWTLARIREGSHRAKVALSNWAHTKHHRKVNDATINTLTDMDEPQALKALAELQKFRRFV